MGTKKIENFNLTKLRHRHFYIQSFVCSLFNNPEFFYHVLDKKKLLFECLNTKKTMYYTIIFIN